MNVNVKIIPSSKEREKPAWYCSKMPKVNGKTSLKTELFYNKEQYINSSMEFIYCP
jgi:hypothetical protein